MHNLCCKPVNGREVKGVWQFPQKRELRAGSKPIFICKICLNIASEGFRDWEAVNLDPGLIFGIFKDTKFGHCQTQNFQTEIIEEYNPLPPQSVAPVRGAKI